ncbi:MAG: helix-turn-helix transcriptional regulator [Lachnospiraceae bacterium]|nr:helix-turn-helix transcriptional regulator [Lachnospiraceae bacterium]
MTSFDKKLKALRKQHHMTQAQLAASMNVARGTVAGYETRSRQPSYEKLAIIADIFHVSVDYLLDDSIIEFASFDDSCVSEAETQLLTKYGKLSVSSQKDLLRYLDLLECWEIHFHPKV